MNSIKNAKSSFLALPKKVIDVLGTATQQLRDSGIEKSALQVGEKAPAIALKDTNNNTVNLYDALQAGPVILKFFRGHW